MKLNPNIADITNYFPGKNIPGAEKLSSNENPLGPSPAALKAARTALENINRYPDGAASELRRALSDYWKIDSSRILPGNGSDELLNLLSAAWMAPGRNAVGTRESFSEYRRAVQTFGGRMKEASLLNGCFNLQAMEDLIDENTSLVFICNPNNPTGTYKNHQDISNFLTRLKDRFPSETVNSDKGGPIVVLDEAYAEFADAEDYPQSRRLLDLFPNLIILRTFSKLYGLAGLRIGYALGSSEIIHGTEKASMPFNTSSPAQAAAITALSDSNHAAAYRELVRREKAFLYEQLTARSIFYYPTQANFICFNPGRPAASVWQYFADGGIVFRDLKSFGLPEMARYTIGRHEHNELFLRLLDGISG